MATQKNYPSVRRDENAGEDHFGKKVPDPYRWLEDPDCEETQAFVKAQNDISLPYLASCTARDKFHARLVALVQKKILCRESNAYSCFGRHG